MLRASSCSSQRFTNFDCIEFIINKLLQLTLSDSELSELLSDRFDALWSSRATSCSSPSATRASISFSSVILDANKVRKASKASLSACVRCLATVARAAAPRRSVLERSFSASEIWPRSLSRFVRREDCKEDWIVSTVLGVVARNVWVRRKIFPYRAIT